MNSPLVLLGLTSALLVPCLLRAADPVPAPVARWTFDTTSEANTYPGAGKGAPVKTYGDVTQVDGRFGKALHFGEQFGIAEIEQSMDDLAPSEFTIMFWIMVEPSGTSVSGYGSLFNCGGKAGVAIQTMQHTRLDVSSCDRWHYVSTAESFSNLKSEWVQVAYTYDGSKGTLYVGGQPFNADASDESAKKDELAFGSLITIGSGGRLGPNGEEIPQNQWGKSAFYGDMDDIRVYDKVLTQEQIAAAESQ